MASQHDTYDDLVRAMSNDTGLNPAICAQFVGMALSMMRRIEELNIPKNSAWTYSDWAHRNVKEINGG